MKPKLSQFITRPLLAGIIFGFGLVLSVILVRAYTDVIPGSVADPASNVPPFGPLTGNVDFNMGSIIGNLVVGQNLGGNNEDYRIEVLRHGTLVAPGTWTNESALQIYDVSGDGPSILQSGNGLLTIGAGRLADMDTNAANATLLYVANDTGNALRVDGKRNVWVGWDRIATSNQIKSLIVQDGNVGIGTTDPKAKLHVASGNIRLDNNQKLETVSTLSGVANLVYEGADNNIYFSDGTNANSVYIRGTNGITVTNTSKIGIGTVSPGSKLEIQTDANTSLAPQNSQLWISGSTSNIKRLYVGMDTSANKGILSAETSAGVYAPIVINPYGGNVGIGTAAPSRPLTVVGAFGASIDLDGNGTATFGTYNGKMGLSLSSSSGEVKLSTNGDSYFNGPGNVGIGTTPTLSAGQGLHILGNPSVIRLTNNASVLGNLEIRSALTGSGNRLDFGEGTDTFLTIRSDDDSGATISRGYVGIGTSGPNSKLHIQGNNWNGITLTTSDNPNSGGTLKYDPVGTYEAGKRFLILSDETSNTDGTNGGVMFRTNNGPTLGNVAPAMTVRETGKVGINTTSPSEQLEVVGKIKGTELCIGTDCRSAWPGAASGLWTPAGSDIYYNTGKVGIGTTLPNRQLDVYAGSNPYISITRGGTATGQGLSFYTNTTQDWVIGRNLGYAGNDLEFYDGAGIAGTKMMIQNDTGNVGIGTTAPGSRRLNVQTSDAGNDVAIDGVISRTSGANYALRASATGASATANYGLYGLASGATTNWGLYIAGGNAYVNGKVGIGTAAPGYELEVVGQINATELCIGGVCKNAWAPNTCLWSSKTYSTGAKCTAGGVTCSVGYKVFTYEDCNNGVWVSSNSGCILTQIYPDCGI